MLDLKRREFIALVGGGAATWPLAGFAQTLARPVVACLVAGSKAGTERGFDGFLQGMRDLGYVEDRNWTFEVRYADGDQAIACGRVGSYQARRARVGRDGCGGCPQEVHGHDPDRLPDTRRSGRLWLCTHSCPARRQRDRRVVDGRRFAEQTTRACGRNGSKPAQSWPAGEPRQSNA